MKKVLLGTSALIAGTMIAVPAAAQLEMAVSSQLRFEAGAASEMNDDLTDAATGLDFGTDAELQFNAIGISDTGIVYGGRVTLEDVPFDADNGGASDDSSVMGVAEAYIFLSGGFGTVTLGADDGASEISRGTPTAGTGITDGGFGDYLRNDPDVAFQHQDDADANKVFYTTRGVGESDGVSALTTNNIELGASYAIETGQTLDVGDLPASGAANEPGGVHSLEFGASWAPTFGGITVNPSASALYIVDTPVNDNIDEYIAWQAGINISTGGFEFGVTYVDNGNFGNGDEDNWGVNTSGTYETGPWTFGLAYSYGHNDANTGFDARTSHTYGAGVSYAWLPGLGIHADVVGFHSEGNDAADYGRGVGDADNHGVVGLTRVQLNF